MKVVGQLLGMSTYTAESRGSEKYCERKMKKALRHHKWSSNSVQMKEEVTFDDVDGAMQEHSTCKHLEN